ncbi:MAG: hypothetical protein EOL98_04405 [Negativicutes bacterium]|nr:hypothetical protein [Negativicutes bacterium]
MKQLINYCPVDGHESEFSIPEEKISDFLGGMGLDGIELFIYQNKPFEKSYADHTVGVHLRYWPFWLDFWQPSPESLNANLKSQIKTDNSGLDMQNKEQWLESIRSNITLALQEKPEYLVWHVSNSDNEEIFTFDFKHTDEEVICATAEVFNAVRDVIPDNVIVLFENLWWPGLRLTNREIVKKFFALLETSNTGIMLDTGHLMNTNPDLFDEKDGMAYLCRTVEALGSYKEKIRGIHLSASLSGNYIKSFKRSVPEDKDYIQLMKHVTSIDRHQPWSDAGIGKLLELVQPSYLVHELYYNSFEELAGLVRQQQRLMKIK